MGISCTEIAPSTYDKGVTLNLQDLSFIGDGESKVVKITSNSPWRIDMEDCDWIKLSKTSGEATEKIIITASKNPSTTDSRTAKIDVISGTHAQTIDVTQERFMMWLTLDRNGETYTANNLTQEESITLQLKSNAEWVADAPEWINLSQYSGEGNADITVTIDNRDIKEDFRYSTITFRCGEVNQTFNIYQVCSYANTYIVKEPGSYQIPAARPDGTVFENAVTADWLYESKNGMVSNVSYSSGQINFNVDATGGYFVIVLKDASEIIWSYTIWCTEELYDIQIGADLWMDRNIGAWSNNLPTENFGGKSDESAYGCYYQWGRKDAFPGPRNSAIDKPDSNRETEPFSTATIEYNFNTSIAPGFGPDETAPTTVSYNTAHPWLFSHKEYSKDDPLLRTLWSDSDKSIYDPCPAGYKVPSAQQTEDMINTLGGWTKTQPFSNSYSRVYTSGNVSFSIPSTAYRIWSNLKATGRMAGYWTSTFSEKDGSGKTDPRFAYRNYDFAMPLSGPSVDVTNRAYAIRCVKIK